MWTKIRATTSPKVTIAKQKKVPSVQMQPCEDIAQLAGLPPSCELGRSPSSGLMISMYQAHGLASEAWAEFPTLSHLLCWVFLCREEAIKIKCFTNTIEQHSQHSMRYYYPILQLILQPRHLLNFTIIYLTAYVVYFQYNS